MAKQLFTSALTICLVLSVHESARAEHPHFQIDGTFGTRFGGTHEVELEADDGEEVGAGRISTDSSSVWGVLASYQIQSNGNVFLSYSRQETTFRFTTSDYGDDGWDIDESSGKGSIEYFQFGGNLQAPTRFLIPYLGVSVGATRIAALEGGTGDWARFNVTLDAGVRIDIIPILDLRVIGRVPFTFPATDIYCFSGVGCAVISNGSPFVQGELQAGLGLKF